MCSNLQSNVTFLCILKKLQYHASAINFVHLWLYFKEVDTVPYWPVRSEFFAPVDEPVPKHLQNVPLKIPAYTGQYRPYRTFRPEKRNLTGTKTERKNRRNAWFEQTQCSKLPPHWHRRLDLLLPFFFFFLFLVCCPCPLLWFLLFFCWTMNIVMWYLFFCLVSYLKFLKPFYMWLALEMLKTYIFLIKDGLNGSGAV